MMVDPRDIAFEEIYGKCKIRSAKKFPLLKLADLPLQNVLKFLEMPDLFDFSTCSSKCQRIVKSLVRRPAMYGIFLMEDFVLVDFSTEYSTKLTWVFKSKIQEVYKVTQPYELLGRRMVNGVIVKQTIKSWSKKTFYTVTNEPETSLRLITNYLLNLFPGPIFKVDISLKLISDSFLDWKEIKKCRMLSITTCDHSKEELDAVIDSFQVSETLYTQDENEVGVISDKIFTAAPHVYIRYAYFMTSEVFLNSRCETLIVGAHDLRETDINLFIKQWINGEREELETLCMWFSESTGIVEEELLISGLSVKEVDLTKRSGFYRIPSFDTLIDCRFGIDIKRSDGKLGTLVANDTVVIFVVWHDLFPDCSVGPMHYWRRYHPSLPIYTRHIHTVEVFKSEKGADEYAEAVLEL